MVIVEAAAAARNARRETRFMDAAEVFVVHMGEDLAIVVWV
jgi:hypothetical protein